MPERKLSRTQSDARPTGDLSLMQLRVWIPNEERKHVACGTRPDEARQRGVRDGRSITQRHRPVRRDALAHEIGRSALTGTIICWPENSDRLAVSSDVERPTRRDRIQHGAQVVHQFRHGDRLIGACLSHLTTLLSRLTK